jgi:plastocyanin
VKRLAAAIALAIAAAACGRAPVAHTVTIEGMKYQPESLTIHVGDSVTWVNRDLFPHTATAKGSFDSSEIPSNASWTYTPTKRASVTYDCTFHPMMKGRLTIQP